MVSEPIVCPTVSDVPGSLVVLCLYILSGADVCSDVHVYEHTCGSQRTILVVHTQAQIWVAASGATYFFKMQSYIRLFILVCVCVSYVCVYMCACMCLQLYVHAIVHMWTVGDNLRASFSPLSRVGSGD